MPVDQDRQAGARPGLGDQVGQRRVIGPVHLLDPLRRLGEGQLADVDLLAVGDDAGDGPQAGGDPRSAAAGEGRQLILEHPLVQLVGRAIDIDEGPGEARLDDYRPGLGRRRG